MNDSICCLVEGMRIDTLLFRQLPFYGTHLSYRSLLPPIPSPPHSFPSVSAAATRPCSTPPQQGHAPPVHPKAVAAWPSGGSSATCFGPPPPQMATPLPDSFSYSSNRCSAPDSSQLPPDSSSHHSNRSSTARFVCASAAGSRFGSAREQIWAR